MPRFFLAGRWQHQAKDRQRGEGQGTDISTSYFVFVVYVSCMTNRYDLEALLFPSPLKTAQQR